MSIDVAFRSPWTVFFLALTFALSVALMLLVIGPVGLIFVDGPEWVHDWTVFGLNAATSGIIADQILRRVFHATILATDKPRLPLIWIWVSIMTLVACLGAERVFGVFKALNLLRSG